ncbi:MAG: hypothetical protein PHD46_03570 [Eubacteriales bacterium]|nr:hypothetical protein [Eubacteriales bacterium]MDD4422099.1 hypothetical protein [Eubacteriales bacterium]
MNEDISEKVRALLEDPEMLAKIAMIASSLGGGKSTPNAPSEQQYESPKDKPVIEQLTAEQSSVPLAKRLPDPITLPAAQDPRLSLLNSLKPFLREERRSKIDNLTKALSVTNLMGSMSKDKKK